MESLLVPLRHYEAGAQLIFVAGARFAYGTAVEQCLSYAAFDRIGAAQMISRIGIDLGGGTADLLVEAKTQWSSAAALQPLRRLVEELLVEPDWAVGLVALDFADRLLYPLLYRHLDEAALLQGAGSCSLLAQHFAGWFDDERYHFCSDGCQWIFDREPEKYVQAWLPVHQVFQGNCGGPSLPEVLAWYGLQDGDSGEYLGSQEQQDWVAWHSDAPVGS